MKPDGYGSIKNDFVPSRFHNIGGGDVKHTVRTNDLNGKNRFMQKEQGEKISQPRLKMYGNKAGSKHTFNFTNLNVKLKP